MKKFKILVVDDDENLALLVKIRLKAANYEVRTANSADEAYRTFLSFKPQLVLTDIGLGVDNGFDLIKRLRNDCGPIKAIYMTGDVGRYEAALIEEIQFHHVAIIAKPFAYDELIAIVGAQAIEQPQAAA